MKYIPGILLSLLIALPAFGETNGMLQVLNTFKTGWEKKNVTILSTCFVKLSDNQRKLYESIFMVVSNVSVNFDIKEAGEEPPMGYVRATLKKSLTYFVPNAAPEVRTDSKDLTYFFVKKEGKWYIVGTIDDKPKLVTKKRVSTLNDIDYINSQLTNLPASFSTNFFKTYQELTVNNLMVNWQGEQGAAHYNIILQEMNGKSIWEFKGIIMTLVKIPVIVFNQLNNGQMYQLQVSAETANKVEISKQILQLKAVK